MDYPSKIVEEAVRQFSKLPGIGKKTALRLVLSLLKHEDNDVQQFADSLVRLKKDLKYCIRCNNISDEDICGICADDRRIKEIICVVEDLRDVMAIENTNHYKGVYHVLGGLISPVDGIGPSDIAIEPLLVRLKEENINEIIFALAGTMEGDTTTFYISKRMKDMEIKITTIARGISVGGELEYADEITLGRSISGRIEYKV